MGLGVSAAVFNFGWHEFPLPQQPLGGRLHASLDGVREIVFTRPLLPQEMFRQLALRRLVVHGVGALRHIQAIRLHLAMIALVRLRFLRYGSGEVLILKSVMFHPLSAGAGRMANASGEQAFSDLFQGERSFTTAWNSGLGSVPGLPQTSTERG